MGGLSSGREDRDAELLEQPPEVSGRGLIGRGCLFFQERGPERREGHALVGVLARIADGSLARLRGS